jgi:hypothetical protein
MRTSGQLVLFMSVQPVLGEHLNTHTDETLAVLAKHLAKCGLPADCELSFERNRTIEGLPRAGVMVVLPNDQSTIGGLNAAIAALYKSNQLNIFATKPIIAGRFSSSANDFVWSF